MDEKQVVERVRQAVERAGSIRALSREWSISPAYLCDLLNGRRAPGPAILGPLGLKRTKTVVYSPTR